jgi:hypothetical protein
VTGPLRPSLSLVISSYTFEGITLQVASVSIWNATSLFWFTLNVTKA